MGEDAKFDVTYDSTTYDIQDFLANHPGGVNYVKPFKTKDIVKPMIQHEHSKAAYYLMREYKKDGRDIKAVEDLEVGGAKYFLH